MSRLSRAPGAVGEAQCGLMAIGQGGRGRNDEPLYTNGDGHVACAWHLPERARWRSVEDAGHPLRCEVCRENERMLRDGDVPY